MGRATGRGSVRPEPKPKPIENLLLACQLRLLQNQICILAALGSDFGFHEYVRHDCTNAKNDTILTINKIKEQLRIK